ncbi:NADPH:quinone oxidoreductase family protein [Sabulicella rubraurantiaca]|uniref:NADPH:quinone oxidoreductase family protein n=1 Tax=Sabulicella rubraurantiaca TaxID=2811429 RepID=UPI001A95733D|nr:NADPH:quinone oxidoreductase family protein [Sabulicella rubraurantiaca]
MKALVCPSWRSWNELELRDIPPPPLREGAVRLKVEAAGVSFASQLVVAGKYQRKPPLPFTPGTEAVGTVLEGPLPAGTRVFAVLDWGAMAQEAVVDAIHCIPIPKGVPDPMAGVAMPISYPTAASALIWRGKVQPGDWVLVHGAAGGVGLAGVEVAKALGCRVVARAAAAKHAMLHERGADLVLDSALPFRDAVREATEGVHCVLDVLGGDTFEDSLRCLGDGGTLVTVGYAAGGIPTVTANILLLKNIGVAGLNWGTYVGWSPGDNRQLHAPRARALWDRLCGWWAEGKLRPEIHARYPLEQFREAMEEVASRRSAGRVVITPNG